MGCVYEAVHRDLDKRVAVKTLLPELAGSAEARARFVREGQAAARIHHPHVVDVTDVVSQGVVTYLVMEFLEGEDLAALIARQGTLSLRETADILLPVVAAISAAHEHGVIHRDLKPENVFLARSAHDLPVFPKVVDFGISKVLGDPGAMPLTGTSTSFGTLHYLPPEQLRGARDADARSDQYALATIIYECLTGRHAFDGDGIYGTLKSVAEGSHAPARTLLPELPPDVDAAIERALSLDPAARFTSVRSLGAALLAYATAGVRERWQGVCAAQPETPAPTRAPSATLILPVVAGVLEARAGAADAVRDAAADAEVALAGVLVARSWAPRLILAGVALGAAIVAISSAHRRADVPEQTAMEIPSPPLSSAPPLRPPAPPASPPPAPLAPPPRVAREPQPPPRSAAEVVTPISRAHDRSSHRHAPQPHFPPRNGAPIVE
jgi:hypothetical protein